MVTEDEIGEGLEAVCIPSWDVDRDRILITDVLGERLAALAVEHDDACRPLHTDEQVVLAALVVVETTNHASAGKRDVRLRRALRQRALAPELHEPTPLVLEALERDPQQSLDHGSTLFTPVRPISAPISGSDSCVPASSHQPLTR